MGDCKICFIKESNKKLPCSHELCFDCCVRLHSAVCPFCRQKFLYTADEIKQRLDFGILNGYKMEIPPGLAFRSEDWIENRQLNNYIIIDDELVHAPFSGIIRNMTRRRRRNLSLDEALERRQIINEKKARHWERKNAKLNKMNWWEV